MSLSLILWLAIGEFVFTMEDLQAIVMAAKLDLELFFITSLMVNSKAT
jgi:hypothetical protein